MKGKIMVLLVALAMCASFAFAAVDDADTSVGQSGQYDDAAGAGSYTVEGGNVTEVNVTGYATTTSWQGFFGNTTANLRLGLNDNILYDFGSTDATAVYATTNQNFDFSSLAAGGVSQVDSIWGLSGVDNATSVFSGSLNPADLGAVTNSTTMNDGNFQAYIANQGATAAKNDFAFGAVVNSAGAVGFNGNTYNYELMVPTDGTNEDYYFFMSI